MFSSCSTRMFLVLNTFNLLFSIESRLVAERILGGENATYKQFRYIVSIQNEEDHICGGGIIGEFFILSAAHCVINYQNNFERNRLKVIANIISIKDIELDNHQGLIIRVVEKAYVPTEFKIPHTVITNSDAVGDISVLKLKVALNLRINGLMKLELPKLNSIFQSYVNKTAIICGFGAQGLLLLNTKKGTSTYVFDDHKLKFMEAVVISKKDCENEYDEIKSNYSKKYNIHNGIINKNSLCAKAIPREKNNPTGVCSGDSGSPLVLNGTLIIGILSRGPESCNEHYLSGIYTKIAPYLTFIEYAKQDYKSPEIRSMVYRP